MGAKWVASVFVVVGVVSGAGVAVAEPSVSVTTTPLLPSSSGSAPTSTFVVVGTAPSLAVSPGRGRAGSTAVVDGRGIGCGQSVVARRDPVRVYWDDLPIADTVAFGGEFTVELRVPADAKAGRHGIGAWCAESRRAVALVPFVVDPVPGTTKPTTVPVTTRPTTADPSTAEPVPSPTTSAESTVESTASSVVVALVQPPETRRRPTLPASLASPSSLTHDLAPYLAALLLGAAMVLLMYLPLIAFPAEIFNKALEERHERQDRLTWPPSVQIAVFGLLAACLLVLVEPDAAFDEKTVALGIGLMVAVVVTTLAYCAPGEHLSFRISRRRAVLRTLPYALAIACLCAVVSRVAEFQPGYVYGLIAGYAPIARSLGADPAEHRRNQGRAVLVGAVVTLAVSCCAWLLWSRVDQAAGSADASFGVLVADSTLSAITLMGVETVLFGLMPIRLLDGLKLVLWSRGAWAAVYAVATVAYLVLLLRDDHPVTPAAMLRAVLLFTAFGVGSFLFWASVLRRRDSRAGSARGR